ncbi:unnamed protein product [Linum tenue]|uniref:NmrA-like domain-containing protein n=1 Tax=Linum tenue TaxID=586396 RepID=A0AAV0NL33_9ROSI|nr:unnamed protein product [Linum tenue]
MAPTTPNVKSRVLIIGATGLIGRHVAEASLDAGRLTYLLIRSTSSAADDPLKGQLLKFLEDKGAIIVQAQQQTFAGKVDYPLLPEIASAILIVTVDVLSNSDHRLLASVILKHFTCATVTCPARRILGVLRFRLIKIG